MKLKVRYNDLLFEFNNDGDDLAFYYFDYAKAYNGPWRLSIDANCEVYGILTDGEVIIFGEILDDYDEIADNFPVEDKEYMFNVIDPIYENYHEVILSSLNCHSELHLHLDGSISVENLKSLAKLENMPVPEDSEIKKLLTVGDNCKDLNEYLEKFDYPGLFLQTKEQLELAIYNLLEELKNAGYIYAEVRFAPQLHMKKGLSQDEVVRSVISGMKKSSLKANLILCAMRNKGNEKENLETADLVAKYLNKGVVCLDLAGAEGLYPNEEFKYLFDHALENAIPFIIHAGEARGAESVWKALEYGAERIGHGVRSLEDEDLVNDLVKNQTPLEVCPKSNIDTGMFKSLSDYPIRKMLDLGLNVSISSDNISVSNGNVITVLAELMDECGITLNDVEQMMINSINSSYLSDSEKEEFISKIKEEF